MMHSGKIKKQKDLEPAFNEVTIFYKEVSVQRYRKHTKS